MAEPQVTYAAGVICKAPSGNVLLMHRTDGEGWAWPAGGVKDGESAEQAAQREVWEETGYRLDGVGVQLMRSTKNGVDFTTFICPVESEFTPVMNHEHNAFMWADPEMVLSEAKMTEASGVGGLAGPMVAADSADAADLDEPYLPPSLGDDHESKPPDPPLDSPAYPPSLAHGDEDDDPSLPLSEDEDDLPDDVLDLVLSVIGDLETRLEQCEGARDDAVPVMGESAAELAYALEQGMDWD